jgi:hypothetical protein
MLGDVSSTLFKTVVSWLYYGKIVHPEDGSIIDQNFAGYNPENKTPGEETNVDENSAWPKHMLVELYVLADRFDIRELRNDIIDTLAFAIRKSKKGLKPATCKFIDSNTTAKSPLRQFLVDRLAYGMRHSMVDQEYWLSLPHHMAITALLLSGQRTPRTLCSPCYQEGLTYNEVELADDDPCNVNDRKSFFKDPCLYHDHADDEEKEACRAVRSNIVDK